MDNTLKDPIAKASPKKRFLTAILIVLILGALGFYASRSLFASYYLNKGVLEYQLGEAGKLERADLYFKKSLWWNSSNPLTHYYLARIAFGHGTPMVGYIAWTKADWPRVIEHYEKALQLGLEKKDARLAELALSDTGRAYRKLKNYKKADDIFREHISRYPEKSFVSRYLLASDDFEINNNPEEALLVLPAAVTAEDKNDLRMFRVYKLLASLYRYNGDLTNAEKYARLAISSVPDGEKNHLDVQIAHTLLAIVRSKAKDLSGAIAEIEKARTLVANTNVPNASNAYKCSLANVYYNTGDFAKAISTANEKLSNRLDKNTFAYADAICLSVLANSNLAIKKSAEAKKYMQQYLDVMGKFADKDIFVFREIVKVKDALNVLQ